MSNLPIETEMEIVRDDNFSFDGFQVVRGEFFAHTYEPSVTFSDYKVYVNKACIKKLPDFNYVQILVNPDQKKMAVRPCAEEEKDSFRWCSATAKRNPKQITCKIFFAKVFTLMGWDPNDRYKLLGKLIRVKDDVIILFDLESPEVYKRNIDKDGKSRISRMPNYPSDWQNQFGVSVAEHQCNIVVNLFDNTAIFGLEKDPGKAETIEAIENMEKESKENEVKENYAELIPV